MRPRTSLETRFVRHLRELVADDAPAHLLVAVSGGCDSMVLLHLLRFAARGLPLRLTVAHLDHAMRSGSGGDARWMAGVCAAWDVPLIAERLEEAPANEDAARRARYAFLRRAAAAVEADHVLTAHHADDQAETVLFRVLRGTGLHGLRGIRARSDSGLLRPLLPFWRRELERYARRHRLRWRSDPTNRSLDPARNRIRLHLLPEIERRVAPGARHSLVRLAELAHEAELGWETVLDSLERSLTRTEGGAVVLARGELRTYDSALGTRLVRRLLRRFGIVLGRTGTRTALQFITDASSGRELQLPDGVRVRVEFDTARIERPCPPAPDEPLVIPAAPRAGAREEGGVARLGGRTHRIRFWVEERDGGAVEAPAGCVGLDLSTLRFPLRVRAWQPGDRVRTPGGSKTLKKLFLEKRVPRSRRTQVPVLVDAKGTVLWVAGLTHAPPPASRTGGETLFMAIVND